MTTNVFLSTQIGRSLAVITLGFAFATTALAQDWKPVTQADMANLLKGNTLEEVEGVWTQYYAADGRKHGWSEGRGIVERKWWIDSSGDFCQTMNRDNSESCDETDGLESDGGTQMRKIKNGQTRWLADIKKGNSRNF